MKAFILLCVIAAASATFDVECGVNQHYEQCGTACPLKCENYKNPPMACVLMCNPGCHCDEGYVKTHDGHCVKPEQCPAQEVCGKHEQYYTCETSCPLTCDNYDNPPEICNLMCNIGCGCKKGYARTNDRRCVKPVDCPAKAPVVKSCLGEAETGMCRAYMPSWHYDARTGKCQKFIYGGCGGNGNRYATEEECMQHCGGGVRIQDASEELCALPSETGLCKGYFRRFFFNSETRQCEPFIYGGCGGNKNNFQTLDECHDVCGNY